MVTFHIPGMTCGGCARSVTNAVKGIDAAARVDVDLSAKLVSVASDADVGVLAKAIADAGYAVEPRPA